MTKMVNFSASANSETPMPWGEHEGTKIEDLPDDYLKWLAGNSDDEDICEAADAEYRYRRDHR